jgi:hypothetical protein
MFLNSDRGRRSDEDGRTTFLSDLLACREEFVLQASRFRWLSLTAIGLLLLCLGGLSGCDSKPPDGSQVVEAGAVSPEQKAKVEAQYKNRHRAVTKPKAR